MVFQILGSRSYRQHYALIPFVAPYLLNKGKIPVYSAIPGITDSTHISNVVIIAIVSNLLQRKSSGDKIKSYKLHSQID